MDPATATPGQLPSQRRPPMFPAERRASRVPAQYRPLHDYLEHRHAAIVVLTFAQIEALLGVALPAPASTERDWWMDAAVRMNGTRKPGWTLGERPHRISPLGRSRSSGTVIGVYRTLMFSARGPFGPWPTVNETVWPARRSSNRVPAQAD